MKALRKILARKANSTLPISHPPPRPDFPVVTHTETSPSADTQLDNHQDPPAEDTSDSQDQPAQEPAEELAQEPVEEPAQEPASDVEVVSSNSDSQQTVPDDLPSLRRASYIEPCDCARCSPVLDESQQDTELSQTNRPPSQALDNTQGPGSLISDSGSHPNPIQPAAYSLLSPTQRPSSHKSGQTSIVYRSNSSATSLPADSISSRRRCSVTKCLVWVALGTMALLLALFAVAHVWVGNIVFEQLKSQTTPQQMLQRGLLTSGHPDQLSISAIHGNLIVLSLSTKMGIDIRKSLGWEHKNLKSANVWQKAESRLANWFVTKAQSVQINISQPVQVTPLDYSVDPRFPSSGPLQKNMLELILPQFDISIGYPLQNPTKVFTEDIAKLVQSQLGLKIMSSKTFKRCLTTAWDQRLVTLAVSVPSVQAKVNYDRFPSLIKSFLRNYATHELRNIYRTITLRVPELPPAIEHPLQAVHIDSYSFFPLASISVGPDEQTRLGIRAKASIPNPLLDMKFLSHLDLNMDIPWQFPLQVFLELPPDSQQPNTTDPVPDSSTGVLMASVMTVPFKLNQTEERLSLTIEGSLVKQADLQPVSGPLSKFLDRFLKGLSTNVSIRYDHNQIKPVISRRGSVSNTISIPQTLLMPNSNQLDQYGVPPPPPFLESLLSPLDIQLPFPGASDTHILKNITIKGMSFSLSGTTLICSGLVHGVLALPAEMQSLSEMLNITEILPDVIVLDGELPDDDDDGGDLLHEKRKTSQRPVVFLDQQYPRNPSEIPGTPNLQDGPGSYPSNAFARLVPPDYVPSQIIYEPSPNDPNLKMAVLIAQLTDVPLSVLPGQGDVFRRYVAKWIFKRGSEGIKTSVFGKSDARASIKGFGKIKLTGLPVQGTFFVGSSSSSSS